MVGKKIGHYDIIEKIGQGGMGIVYKGIHTKLEQEVAIKVLSPQFSQDPSMRERFIKEAKIQARFSHPNVVNILNYLEDEGNIFLIMEYVNGETLENRLKKEGSLPIEKAVSISLSVLEALDFMHSKGVIHRDIKPSNIMLTDSGLVKVTDFGISKVIGEKGQTRTGMVGTFRYISPEQILGEETSVASDVYSFGITLYEMVAGRVPFNGDSEYKIMKGHLEEKPLPPWRINSNVPKELGRVILRAIAKSPKDRYQNVKGFAEDLEVAIKKPKESSIPPRIISAGSWRIPSPNLGKRRFLVGLLGLGIILLVPILWVVKKPNGITSTPSIISQPNTDSYQTYESSLDLEFPRPNDKSSEGALKEVMQSGVDTEKEEPNEETLKEMTLFERDIESEKVKKEKQVSEAPVNKEKRFFPKPSIEKRGRWKIRK